MHLAQNKGHLQTARFHTSFHKDRLTCPCCSLPTSTEQLTQPPGSTRLTRTGLSEPWAQGFREKGGRERKRKRATRSQGKKRNEMHIHFNSPNCRAKCHPPSKHRRATSPVSPVGTQSWTLLNQYAKEKV